MQIKPSYSPTRYTGFTITELLVVIGILAILISIMIPSFSMARGSAKKTATLTQLRNIALACDSYYTMFGAYPGFISEQDWNITKNTDAFSDSQAMLVSLTGRYFEGNPTAAPYNFTKEQAATVGSTRVGLTNYYVARNQTLSPRNYAINTAVVGYPGPGRDYDAFLAPKPADLSTAVLPNLTFPVLVDSAYGQDALPILYYRQHVKPNPLDTNYAVIRNTYNTPANAVASYYIGANHHLAALGDEAAGSSSIFAKSRIERLALTHDDRTINVQALLTQTVGGTSNVPRGRYVLISPGPDRIYGLDANGNCDDIIVAGGN